MTCEHPFRIDPAPAELTPGQQAILDAIPLVRSGTGWFVRAPSPALPIDLVEPDAPPPQGDRLPCHLFMPEVAWPETLPPVLRTPRRELYLQTVQPWSPAYGDDWQEFDDLSDEAWQRILRLLALGLFLGLLVALGAA